MKKSIIFLFFLSVFFRSIFCDSTFIKNMKTYITIEKIEKIVRKEFPGKQIFLQLDMYKKDIIICKVEDEFGKVLAVYKFPLTPFKKKVKKIIEEKVRTKKFKRLTQEEQEENLDNLINEVLQEEIREVLNIPKHTDVKKIEYKKHWARLNVVDELQKESYIEKALNKLIKLFY